MGDLKVDEEAFKRRMKKLYAAWREASEGDPLNQVDALVVAVGTVDVVYSKSISVQTWLFGYELPQTIMAVCKSSIIVLTSSKNLVQQVEGSSKDGSIPSFKLLVRDKNDKDTSNIQTIINAIKASSKGKTIGVFSKEKFPGDLINSWKKAIDEAAFEKVDISAPIALVMAPKENLEVSLIKKACNATMDLYNKYVKERLLDIIDEEMEVKHSDLACKIKNEVRKRKYDISGLDVSRLVIYYNPILQSGGEYNLAFDTEAGDNILHFGSIVCMLGLRYKSYCSNIARTLMVGPTQEMQANYALLLKAQDAAITALRHGVKLSEVYDAAVEAIKSEKPELVDKSTKNAGFGMGLVFREDSMLISPESGVVAVKGMVFNLNFGFSDLLNKEAKDDKGKIYSLFIGDTVLVNDENTAGTVLTPLKRQTKNAFIFLQEEEEKEEAFERRSQRDATIQSRRSSEANQKRRKNQEELLKKAQSEALERIQQKAEDEESHGENKTELEGVIKQDSLIISPSARNPKLNNVYIRPNILSKRTSGVLEAHTNGLRFTSAEEERVDILYNNIKTAFFQPCDNELVILVHFHLKNAIPLAEKKLIDVQFYTEVGEVTTDLGKHQYSHDRDDLRAEQSERKLRKKLKETFMMFCNKVSAKGDIKFEIPVRDLRFHGAPNRSTVLIQPTDSCLINLTEWPPFVVTLKEVEVVHFERVQFQLKNFDMAFVFKDYRKKVKEIRAVPMNNLDCVQDWLNEHDIVYIEGIDNELWTNIVKIRANDPTKFYIDGGWSLYLESDQEDSKDHNYTPSVGGSEENSNEDSGESEESEESEESAEPKNKKIRI